DQSNDDVKAMESGQREEGRREQVGADGDAIAVQAHVLRQLAQEEYRAQCHARKPPCDKAAPVLASQLPLREVHGAAAGEQEQTEKQRAWHVQVMRTGTWTSHSILQIRDDQRAKAGDLAEDKCENTDGRRTPGARRI